MLQFSIIVMCNDMHLFSHVVMCYRGPSNHILSCRSRALRLRVLMAYWNIFIC